MTPGTTPTILTIGHSNHSLAEFIRLLEMNGVTAVADVRSAPYSRHRPEFNREPLRQALRSEGITYIFLGQELGARSNDPSCYENGRIQYRRLAKTELFQSGLRRVMKGAQPQRIALLCAESEPLACHRSLLVARELEGLGASVSHILPDGKLEPHGDAIWRLLAMYGLEQEDMFRTRQEAIEEACARQEQRIAYVDEELSREAQGVME